MLFALPAEPEFREDRLAMDVAANVAVRGAAEQFAPRAIPDLGKENKVHFK